MTVTQGYLATMHSKWDVKKNNKNLRSSYLVNCSISDILKGHQVSIMTNYLKGFMHIITISFSNWGGSTTKCTTVKKMHSCMSVLISLQTAPQLHTAAHQCSTVPHRGVFTAHCELPWGSRWHNSEGISCG